MFRTLASYIFGGVPDEVPQVPIECETREVNDWLVVNLPDQLEGDIELDDDTERDDMDSVEDNDDMELVEDMDEAEDIEADEVLTSLPRLMDSNCNDLYDYDDILASVSHLMPLDSYEVPRMAIDYYESDEEEFIDIDALFESYTMRDGSLDHTNIVQPYKSTPVLEMDRDFEDAMVEFKEVCATLKAMLDLEELVRSTGVRAVVQLSPNVQLSESLRAAVVQERCKLRELQAKNAKAKEAKRTARSYLTCHPVYSNTYVNHRHPASPPKADFLQKIKDQEPEQRAKIYVLKKHNTRGNLNRQNKNYIYESSTKTNRRKNFQRHLSGANNNRKC